MTPATDDQIRDACMTRSATEAVRYLAAHGLHTGASRCNIVISRLIEDGVRQPKPRYAFKTAHPERNEVATFDAIVGSKRLLEAHIRTGMHWIQTPEQMQQAVEIMRGVV